MKLLALLALLLLAPGMLFADTILDAKVICGDNVCEGMVYDFNIDDGVNPYPYQVVYRMVSSPTPGTVVPRLELFKTNLGADTKFNGTAITSVFAALSHTHTASQISDSTTVGRSVLTAADQAAARTAIGAGTSSFNGVYSSLTSIPSTFTPAAHVHSGADITTGTITVGRLPTGIDAANLANGMVSNTEFQFVDGVTSAIQTQINGKFATPTGSTSQYVRGDGSLATLPTAAAWSVSPTTRSLTTSTGAAGFQMSSTRNSSVYYNVKISVTATIGANAEGYVVLEIAPTNSATPSDWVECARFSNGQTITLAVVLQSIQPIGGEVSCDVPSGYYAKLRTVNVAATPTYTYISGYEVLK